MELNDVIGALMHKAAELQGGPQICWRYPRRTPEQPLKARPRPSWPTWPHGDAGVLKKNSKNWFYGEVEFPGTKSGVRLRNTQGWFFIYGWCPFTLWLDGVETFKETHAWHATGPIADPVVAAIEPGRKHHLVLCVEPTELPAGFNPVGIFIRPKACVEIGIELSAAAAQLRYARALARNAKEKQAVLDAAALLDLDAVKANRWKRALESVAAMESALAWLSKRARAMTVHIVGHTHIDMNWMWTWPDTVHCIRRDIKSVTDMQDDYPDLTFTHSQVPTYEVVKKMDAGVFEKVRRRIKEGRWENAAGTWVEGDLNMADGESIARHMLYAADWGKKNLGTQAKVLWEPDTFGHPGNMPQLAVLGEHDCYFHWRCNPGARDNWPFRIWEGVDGTPIVAFSTAYGSGLQPEQLIGSLLEAHRFGFNNAFHVWGMGDHGGGLPRFQIDMLNRYRDKPVMPGFKFSTMKRLLGAVNREKGKLPRNKGVTYHLFEGCFTTHARIKKYSRRCEGALLTAEALSALAGLDRKDALRRAWTGMLFNHFHDIFDGAAVHDAYIDAYEQMERSLKTAGTVIRDAVKILAEPTRGGKTLVLLDQLGFERTEPVCTPLPKATTCVIDADGNAVPVQHKDGECLFIAQGIPAFGAKAYRISDGLPTGTDLADVAVTEDAGYFRIETAAAVARLGKRSGAIGSYYDKALGRELVAYGVPKHLTHVPTSRADLALNVFQIIDEAPNGMPAWLINDVLKQENLLRDAEVALLEAGPVFARFRVIHRFRASSIEEDIVFYRDWPRVDFETTIDWREKGSSEVGVPQLKVSFATAMSAPRARFEGPFVVTEYPADGLEYPTQKWADVSGRGFGFALFNDSKYGCDALGGRLRITLLRNAYGPDPESDNGIHTVRFAFVPHGARVENAGLIRAATAFNRPPVCVRTDRRPAGGQPWLTVEGADSVVCTALRVAEHSSKLIVRFFETAGKNCSVKVSLGRGILSADEVNFLENPTGRKVKVAGGKAALRFHPYEVKTLLARCR